MILPQLRSSAQGVCAHGLYVHMVCILARDLQHLLEALGLEKIRRLPIRGEKRLLASSRLSVCPLVRRYQRGSHWTDFREIRFWEFQWKSVNKLKILQIRGKNIERYTGRLESVSHCTKLHMVRNNAENALLCCHGKASNITLSAITYVRK